SRASPTSPVRKSAHADAPTPRSTLRSGLLRAGELLQREGVADVVERLVAGEAFGVVDAGPVLLVGGEHGVVPVLVAQHLGNVVSPTRFARHRRIGDDLLRGDVGDVVG